MKISISRMLTSATLIVALCFTTLPTVGCSTATTVNEINVVLTEAANILVVADPNAAWVPQLQSAIAALKIAESSWQSGGTVQEVINALNTVEAITAVIPLTAQYSPLIDVLVAGIEAVLAALPASAEVTISLSSKAMHNPHIGRAVIQHRFMRSRVTEFKGAWNGAAIEAALPGAEIK